jgi:hypothetical protein
MLLSNSRMSLSAVTETRISLSNLVQNSLSIGDVSTRSTTPPIDRPVTQKTIKEPTVAQKPIS